jgi:hypothetical protein
MNMSYRRGFSGAGLALLSTIVAADPLVLDTEQKAASGVSAALFTSHDAPSYSGFVSYSVLDYADRALNIVKAQTTPAELLSTTGGVVIDCAIAGTVRARMADSLPRVLRLRWDGCVVKQFGYERTYNGPMAITLTSDTLEPQRVASIRLGNTSADFVEQFRSVTPDQIDNVTNVNNVTLRGDIATNRAFFGAGSFVVSSSYTMNGYVDNQRQVEFPDGRPSALYGFKVVAEKTRVIESTIVSETGMVDDREVQWLSGSLTGTQIDLPPFDVMTQRYAFDRYRVHQITDYEAWTSQVSVDGGIDITWNPWRGSGCMNGQHSFRTRAPLVNNLDAVTFESGDLLVNGTVAARFYSPTNPPPSLPPPVNGMLLNMRVQDVGTYNYDVSSTSEALIPAGQCSI